MFFPYSSERAAKIKTLAVSQTASTCIRRWAIGAQRSSRRWPVSLNPGVRYFWATSV